MTSSSPDGVRTSTTAQRREQASRQILASCSERFKAPDFEVSVDDKGTVWVRRADGRSVGLQPWQLRERTAEEIIARVESKLQA